LAHWLTTPDNPPPFILCPPFSSPSSKFSIVAQSINRAAQVTASAQSTADAKAAQVTFKAEIDVEVKGSLKSTSDNLVTLQTKVAGIEGTVNMLKSSGGGCIPYVEYETKAATATDAAECKLLSYECEGGTFESVRPTRKTDRVCKKWTRQSCKEGVEYAADGSSRIDSRCVAATACKANEYAEKELTYNTDRVCLALPTKCTVASNGLTKVFVGGKVKQVCCRGDKPCGGDGSTKALAGKSCYTIRFVHEKKVSGKYWVYEKEIGSPYEVFCEMVQCGWDRGGSWSDKSQCGGWSLVMKTTSGSTCLNRYEAGLFAIR
jgi:hypothetical protein